jgi:hypothetical protein
VVVLADVPPLPLPAGSFDQALASHVYSHLERAEDRRLFVDEALRVASTLVIVEQAPQPSLPPESWERRWLCDGSEHRVFERFLAATALDAEIGGEVPLDTGTYVAATSSRRQ